MNIMDIYGSFIVDVGSGKKERLLVFGKDNEKCIGNKIYCIKLEDTLLITNNAIRVPTGYTRAFQTDYKVSEDKVDALYPNHVRGKLVDSNLYQFNYWKGERINCVTEIMHPAGKKLEVGEKKLALFNTISMLEKSGIKYNGGDCLVELSVGKQCIHLPVKITSEYRVDSVRNTLQYYEVNGIVIECNYTYAYNKKTTKLTGRLLDKKEVLYSIWKGEFQPDICHNLGNTKRENEIAKYAELFEVEKEFQGQDNLFMFNIGNLTLEVKKVTTTQKNTMFKIFVIKTKNMIIITNTVKIKQGGKGEPAILISPLEYFRNNKSNERVIKYLDERNMSIREVMALNYNKGEICDICTRVVDNLACIHKQKCIKCIVNYYPGDTCDICFPGSSEKRTGCYYDFGQKTWKANLVCVCCKVGVATEVGEKLCEPCYNSKGRLCETCGNPFIIKRVYCTKCLKCYCQK